MKKWVAITVNLAQKKWTAKELGFSNKTQSKNF